MHLFLKAILVFSLMIMFDFCAFAQEDSGFAVPKARPMSGTYHELEHGFGGFETIDTGLHQMQKFDPGYLHNLGTPASPVFDLIWNPLKTAGFDPGFHQWDTYRMTSENVHFYNTQNPFAELYYVQGASDIQAFRATFSQNIRPYWNFSLHINGLSTNKGYYDPQASQVTNYAANTWYRSPDERYMLVLSGVFNNFQSQENGGISSDSSFLNAPVANRTGLPVNFGSYSSYDSSKQIFTESFITLRQYYRFGPEETIKVRDTDSVAAHIIHPEYFISHTFEYHNNKYDYRDMNLGIVKPFYQAIQDPAFTSDRFLFEEYTNKIAAGRSEFVKPVRVNKKIDSSALKKHPLYYELYAKYSIINAFDASGIFNKNAHFDNMSMGFEISEKGKLNFNATAEYFMEGYNKNDYFLNTHMQLPFLPRILRQVNFDFKTQQAAPSYTDQVFRGNHFSWTNQFAKTQSSQLDAYFSDSLGLKLGAYLRSASNLIYYDTLALPAQEKNAISYLGIFASKEFIFGPVHLITSFLIQKPLGDTYAVRVPQRLARASCFFEHYLFKKAMLFQGGFDFSYGSPYRGYGYMPEISRFYVQDNIMIGNYQVWDLWVAGKVKRFTFFGKLEHLNQGLSGNWYFVAPHYPLTPLTYRFGVKWMFFN